MSAERLCLALLGQLIGVGGAHRILLLSHRSWEDAGWAEWSDADWEAWHKEQQEQQQQQQPGETKARA